MCNRALDAEQRVLNLIQLQEAAKAEEILADNALKNARAQVQVAQARLDEQEAQNTLAVTQAAQAQTQAALAATQNNQSMYVALAQGVQGAIPGATKGAQTGAMVGALLGPVGAVVGGIVGLVGGAAVGGGPGFLSAAFASENQSVYDDLAGLALEITTQTLALASASLEVASEELLAVKIAREGALAYARFLTDERLLDSEAYAQLVSLAQQISEAYLREAIRLSWLAQRALSHETRKGFAYVSTIYDEEDEVSNLTRAQQLTADLELMRAGYVAGETSRRQEIKFTLSLRNLQPGALGRLRETGQCVFVVQQEVVDRAFPGLLLHSLQEMRVEFIGTLPPEGPRGILSTLGKSAVRVPNDPTYLDGALTTLDAATTTSRAGPKDWVVSRLATATGEYAGWNQFIMKEINTFGTTLTLSEFDVRSDRAVLQLPQGMLGAVALLGLDNMFRLKLHRQSNAFEFDAIQDVEITFWFLAAYDESLEAAQREALRLMAEEDGSVQGTLLTSAKTDASSMWASFSRDRRSEEVVDQRYLVFDRGSYLPAEEVYANKRLTNLYLGTPTDQGIVVRLLCTEDPVGILVTTKLGCAFTAIGMTFPPNVPPGSNPRQPDSALSTWVQGVFYGGGLPSLPPSARWVIKVIPEKANPAGGGFDWRAKDADGNVLKTAFGALSSGPGGRMTWLGDTALAHVRLAANVRLNGGILRMMVRRTGANDEYRLVLDNEGASKSVALHDVVGGVPGTALQSKPLAYPADEFLAVMLDIYGDATGTTLRLEIDGIEVLKVTDTSVSKLAGAIGFEVVAGTVEIDDVSIVKLSKLGTPMAVLAEDKFSSTTRPATWSFTDGTPAWAVSTTGHTYASLANLEDFVIRIDYGFGT
jgi:hypothetical protein